MRNPSAGGARHERAYRMRLAGPRSPPVAESAPTMAQVLALAGAAEITSLGRRGGRPSEIPIGRIVVDQQYHTGVFGYPPPRPSQVRATDGGRPPGSPVG